MRELTVIEFLTLDGVMQSLGSPDEDRDGGFEHGGWSAPYVDDVMLRKNTSGMSAETEYLFGRRTYEKMAAHWPNEPDDNPFAKSLNAAKKYVASTTLTHADWAGTEILTDPAESIPRLKATPGGGIAVLGSGLLVQTLIAEDLIDEYRLFIHPLVLGKGKRLFRDTPMPVRLRLTDCTPTTTGVLLLTYRRT